jgi:hypothetical protein
MLPLIVVACAQFTIARDAKTVNVTTASFLNMLFLAMLMLTSSFYYDSILTELRVIIGRSPEYLIIGSVDYRVRSISLTVPN